MFEAVADLGGLDVQLVFYRGYAECSAADLHWLMRTVSCVGGNTQIARVLDHTIAETKRQKVSALLFIGDSMEEKVHRLCHLAGELGSLSVPVFVFHEGNDPIAAAAFEQIAALSRPMPPEATRRSSPTVQKRATRCCESPRNCGDEQEQGQEQGTSAVQSGRGAKARGHVPQQVRTGRLKKDRVVPEVLPFVEP
jgi:hypothetical protein